MHGILKPNVVFSWRKFSRTTISIDREFDLQADWIIHSAGKTHGGCFDCFLGRHEKLLTLLDLPVNGDGNRLSLVDLEHTLPEPIARLRYRLSRSRYPDNDFQLIVRRGNATRNHGI